MEFSVLLRKLRDGALFSTVCRRRIGLSGEVDKAVFTVVRIAKIHRSWKDVVSFFSAACTATADLARFPMEHTTAAWRNVFKWFLLPSFVSDEHELILSFDLLRVAFKEQEETAGVRINGTAFIITRTIS